MMSTIENLAVGLVAILHLTFLVLEMFLWNKPLGRKIFGLKQEFADQSKALAANQGLYNGFLALGLIWSLTGTVFSYELKVFFLSCIICAGIYGAISVNRTILWVQALPAAIALLIVTTN